MAFTFYNITDPLEKVCKTTSPRFSTRTSKCNFLCKHIFFNYAFKLQYINRILQYFQIFFCCVIK